MPAITDAVTIDGTTQPGFAGTPVVELSGASAGLSAGQPVNGLTLSVSAAGSTVRGLAINDFSGPGIMVQGDGNTIQGDFIGTDVTGTTALGNQSGIQIASSGNTIGGTAAGARNVISGNHGDALDITGVGTTGNLVQGNLIGTNAAGTAALANGDSGILIDSIVGNTIGGTVAGAATSSRATSATDLHRQRHRPTGNLVQGNFIGTDVAGTAALGNGLRAF